MVLDLYRVLGLALAHLADLYRILLIHALVLFAKERANKEICPLPGFQPPKSVNWNVTATSATAGVQRLWMLM